VDGDFEGFGMVLVEAQACGKAVIAGTSGGTAETMRRGETGLLVNCDAPEPLANAVCQLLSDDQRRRAMGHAARQWVEEKFDWNRLAAQAATILDLPFVRSSQQCATNACEVAKESYAA
jgi:phosphatidyl-myo-inositol dimannoside synthase